MIPHHLYGRNVEPFVRCMDEAQRWSEAYHVELWVALGKEAAFEPGMNTAHDRFFAEEFLVGTDDNLLQFRIGTHLPGGITVARLCLSASKLEDGLNSGAHVVEV